MPYRVDIPQAGADTLDRLIDLGAIDIEETGKAGIAALMPDSVPVADLIHALGRADVAVSPAQGRDAQSVWVLSPRPIRIGCLRIVPAHLAADPGDVQLIDAPAFGTGLHPTTSMCLEILTALADANCPDTALDVGTGSGVLALAALRLGVTRAVGIDIEDEALRTAAENARRNRLDDRLRLARGGPDAITGTWPLVLANVLPGPLIEMAPSLVRRVGHHGRLILSGIPRSVEEDVGRVYRRLGMRRLDMTSRAGWIALELQATW